MDFVENHHFCFFATMIFLNASFRWHGINNSDEANKSNEKKENREMEEKRKIPLIKKKVLKETSLIRQGSPAKMRE